MKYWNKLPKNKVRREPENRDILTYYWDAYRWRSFGQDVQGDVSLTLTLLEKEGFENRMELFEYRDNFSKLIGKSRDECSSRKSQQV